MTEHYTELQTVYVLQIFSSKLLYTASLDDDLNIYKGQAVDYCIFGHELALCNKGSKLLIHCFLRQWLEMSNSHKLLILFLFLGNDWSVQSSKLLMYL